MCSIRLLLTVVACTALIPSSVGQTCTSGASTGPCIGGAVGDSCSGGTCVNSDDGVQFIYEHDDNNTCLRRQDNPLTGVSDCPARVAAGYCTRKYYKGLMKRQCRKSCGYCTSSSSSSTCADLTNPSTGVSDCTRLSYLCSNAVYASVMAVQCRSTCGYC